MKGQSSRLEQAEDRISELEDEMEIKGKTKELLLKQKTKPENHGYLRRRRGRRRW
jgi:hypothetical protein